MRSRVVIGVMGAVIVLLLLVIVWPQDDGNAASDPAAGEGDAPVAKMLRFTAGPGGRGPDERDDALLAEARDNLAGAGLPDAVRAALLASDDPDHARAQRILRAMQGEGDDAPGDDDEGAQDTAAQGGVAIVAPTLPDGDGTVAPVTGGGDGSPSSTAGGPADGGGGGGGGGSVRNTISDLGLQSTSTGAALTLISTSGVMVGVANQRESGIVRLIVEANATPKVLASRPGVDGVRVASVKRVGRSVFVTLKLAPGWALDRIHRTRRGATVELVRGK